MSCPAWSLHVQPDLEHGHSLATFPRGKKSRAWRCTPRSRRQVVNSEGEFPSTYSFILALKPSASMADVDLLCSILAGNASDVAADFRGSCHDGLQAQVQAQQTNPLDPVSWPFTSIVLASEVRR